MPVLDDAWRTATLPTTDEEIWRYSRIAELDLARYIPAAHEVVVDGPSEHVTLGGDTVELFDDAPDLFATINRSIANQVHVVVPAGTVVPAPIVITHTVPAGGALVAPRLVIEAGRDSQVTVIERFVSAADGDALVLPVLQIRAVGSRPRAVPRRQRALGDRLVDRPPAGRGRSRLVHAAGHRGARRRLRPRAHRGPPRRPGRFHPPGRAVLRRWRPDARLPHHPGPRRAAHVERPAVQGRRAGPFTQRLHRPHPHPRERQGHRRLPDEPQPDAQRRRLGRERAEPRHPDQRREVQPRVHGRPDRRGPAVLPREPWHPARGRRAARRARLLRRGARPAAGQLDHRCDPPGRADQAAPRRRAGE